MRKSTKRVSSVIESAAEPSSEKKNVINPECFQIAGLETKISMPKVGFGTYRFKGSGAAQKATIDALKTGYRLIDTAYVYGGEKTEMEIGKALNSSQCPVPRSDIFITTKHWRSFHGYDETMKCFDTSLKRLGLTYIDLYLIHWPGPAYHTMGRSKAVMEASPDGPFVYAKKGHERENLQALRAETWRAFEDLLKSGKCRAIGVSNFTVAHLKALKKTATIWPPAVNQVELHPYHPQSELISYCAEEGIQLQAYASLGGQDAGVGKLRDLGGSLLHREEVVALSKKYGVSCAAVLLKWALQQNIAVIPKSSKLAHMTSNFKETTMGEWELDQHEISSLTLLGSTPTRLCWARDPLQSLDFE